MLFRKPKYNKLLFLFAIVFAIVIAAIYSIVPAAPNVKLIVKASQLQHHALFIVPAGSLQIDFTNDTKKQCLFVMFPYQNAGNLKTTFMKPVAPAQKFPFKIDVAEDDAYALACTGPSLGFAWRDLPVMLVSGPNEKVWHFEIKNGSLIDFKTKKSIAQLRVPANQKVWMVIKNDDLNYWSVNLTVGKQRVAKEGMPIKVFKKRYWPPLKNQQVLVLGPISFERGTYLLSVSDFYCKKDCRLQSLVRVFVK